MLSDLKYLYLFLIFAYVFLFPFSKVEESFNLQATHDLLHFSNVNNVTNLINFDHLEFPGVVPRTFLGAIAVAVVSWPFFTINYFIISGSKYLTLLIIRCVLGLITWFSANIFVTAVKVKFGTRCGKLVWLLHCFQFHLPFYSSRTLPNTFALVLVYLAYASWLQDRGLRCLVILGYATVIFRCDVLVLLLPLTIQMLLFQEISFIQALSVGIREACCALLLTGLVDSYFWRRWLWPEGVVLFFNTVENKSSEWGMQPWHWYFTSALTRSMHLLLPLVALGLTDLLAFPSQAKIAALAAQATGKKAVNKASDVSLVKLLLAFLPSSSQTDPQATTSVRLVRYYCAPIFIFLALYSFLPHKELRFIFPALPMLTLAAASALDRLLPPDDTELTINKKKASSKDKSVPDSKCIRTLSLLMYAGVCIFVAAAVSVCSVFALASYHNYPGGRAMQRLLNNHIYRHICNDTDSSLSSNHLVWSPDASYSSGGSSRPGSDSQDRQFSVHIDVAPAMTGVSRFLQASSLRYECPGSVVHTVWMSYSKREGLTDFGAFDWLLTDDPIAHGKKNQFTIAEAVEGFDRLKLSKTGIAVQLTPKIYILKNNKLPSS